MKRELDFNDISDGKKYSRDDLVKVGCNDCKGCSECCRVTDDTIHLDPYDVYVLSKTLGKTFEELMALSYVNLTLIDGVITPYLCKGADGACVFLKAERCMIHAARPGFCRLFPLGRIYNEEGGFDYFIQVHECPYPLKTKVKVKNWLGIDKIKEYEKFVLSWHDKIKSISKIAESGDAKMLKVHNMKMLNTFFLAPFEGDFYEEFYKRLELA